MKSTKGSSRKVAKTKKAKVAKKKAKVAKKKSAKAAVRKISISKKILAHRKKTQKNNERFEKEGQKLFKQAVKEIFKKFKNLERFSWKQYTPHWNDGSECVFSCYFSSLLINDEKEENAEDYYYLGQIYQLLCNKEEEKIRIEKELNSLNDNKEANRWNIDSLKRELEVIEKRDIDEVAEKYEIKKEIAELIENIDESVYKNMFGEGEIIVTRNGITVQECEHD